MQGPHERVGGPLIEVALTQRVDVVVVDGADDPLEEPGLFVDPTFGGGAWPEQPATAQKGDD